MDADHDLFDRTIWGDAIEQPFDARTVTSGMFDQRVLDQAVEWVDGSGRQHRLADLDPGWRRNIGAFLYLKARSMHAIEALCEAAGVGASAAAYLAMLGSGAPATADVDPYDWLEGTPLFRALRTLQPDLASQSDLRAWAEAAQRAWAADPDTSITLPQDPDRLWNA